MEKINYIDIDFYISANVRFIVNNIIQSNANGLQNFLEESLLYLFAAFSSGKVAGI